MQRSPSSSSPTSDRLSAGGGRPASTLLADPAVAEVMNHLISHNHVRPTPPSIAQIATAQIDWGSSVETTLHAITGGASTNEAALQRVLAAKRSALLQRLDPEGHLQAAALEMQTQSSPIHNRSLSPSKERCSPTKHPTPLQRKFSIRPASAAAGYSSHHFTDSDTVFSQPNQPQDDDLPLHARVAASPASVPSQPAAASSPAARRLERFAAMDARVSNTIEVMQAQTHLAAAMSAESPLPGVPPSPSRPLSAALASRSSAYLEDAAADRANSEEMYFLQVQVDNNSSGFADRFDCVVMTNDSGDRRKLTASFPQLLMSKDRYLLFAGKPKMWRGLPTDKVFGSGVARMTDFDPRTVLSLSEYLPWVTEPRQLLGKSLRVQVFSRVKRDNDRRCVVDKMITFNTDFTVETREFPGSIKGVRDGQRPASAAGKRRPQSALM